MKGRLRRACYFYGAGLFGRCISELAGLERREDFQAEEREKTAQVRVAIAESLRDEMTRVEDLVQKGDALGAEGHLGFLEISAKDTEWEAEVRAKRKAITPAPEFKRELAAGREILRLEVLLKDKRRIAGQQDMARKLVDEFLKKHKGTRACQKAEELLARLARSRPKKPTAKE